ncbi:MAG: hypothetical protein GY862_19615 [Gammaproteobacteria bacterium]|nr:hypothetical protein [Gammaproteobacteria bacterium]
MMRRIVLLSAITAMAASSAMAKDASQMYAYSLLAQSKQGGTMAYARVITNQKASCKKLTLTASDGQSIQLAPRKNPHHFPVAVCEAVIPFEQALTVSGTHITLGAVKMNPEHIVVYGDSGCKAKQCSDQMATPFINLARAGARMKPAPDLIVHMGDYNYRGTGSTIYAGNTSVKTYDAGDDHPDDPNCSLSNYYYSRNGKYSIQADNWKDWQLDFFEPARSLLPAGPLAVCARQS